MAHDDGAAFTLPALADAMRTGVPVPPGFRDRVEARTFGLLRRPESCWWARPLGEGASLYLVTAGRPSDAVSGALGSLIMLPAALVILYVAFLRSLRDDMPAD